MIADRIITFLDSLSREELERLPPAERPPREAKAGALSRLKAGERGE